MGASCLRRVTLRVATCMEVPTPKQTFALQTRAMLSSKNLEWIHGRAMRRSDTGHFQLQSINRPEAPIALKASVFTIKSVKGPQKGYYLAAQKKKCNRHDDPPSSYALLHSPGS